ncbi:CaiB/BaiF CoA transferase family protein [Streptomyces sp. cg40]|uniref:CaiB/BaiF CoA transferase family protein n=1 Tax=Streptomyces sp. cg40 TaxID=3419764 RepID=UPI003D01615E
MTPRIPHAPLEGVTVLGLEQAVAAPLCTRHLADLGARVIKVEQPGVGDSARHYDDAVRGLSSHFAWLNHGKESVALDLADGRDAEVFDRLLAQADVLVSNLAPGALDRLGLNRDQLLERHPRLIVVDISGYGRGGPLDHKRAYDLLVQAEGGACAITGVPGQPVKSGIPIADVGTGLYAFSAVLTALYDRDRTGRGTVVSLAMIDVVAELMGVAINQLIHTGSVPDPVGMGSPMVSPYGAYRTRDERQVVLGTTSDREWQRFALKVLDRPDLAEDPRLVRNPGRVTHRGELDEIIGAWCGQRDCADIQRLADAAGIGNAVLNDVPGLVAHPQLTLRERWRQVGSPVGDLPVLLPPAASADWLIRAGQIPALGEHTAKIRGEAG